MSSATVTPKASKKQAAIQFLGMSPAEQTLISHAQAKISQVVQAEATVKMLSEEAGRYLYDCRALGRKDRNRYISIPPGKTKPEEVGRFDAVINSVGIARATAYRYIRAWEAHLQQVNPVPASVIALAQSSGVLDMTSKVATDALADAFLAAYVEGKPLANPTPAQVMQIVADAIDRAEQAPVSAAEEFKALLNKALTFAHKHGITAEVRNTLLEEAIAAAYGPAVTGASLGEIPADVFASNKADLSGADALLAPIQADVDASQKKQ
jgi:hypothetical protein